ncbi:hypothetical protein [Pelagibacterium halotolerans]|uniref:hypothetical protein n=1 Tax=Pelagibacterium halotolerans TaxID=531813 RepID=UPI00384D6F85
MIARQIGADVVKALAVLAVFFLSFGYGQAQAPVFADDSVSAQSVYSTVSYCGQGPGEHGPACGPCHACRVTIADLPPPPSIAEPAYLGFSRIVYIVEDVEPAHNFGHRPANPRAPPALV